MGEATATLDGIKYIKFGNIWYIDGGEGKLVVLSTISNPPSTTLLNSLATQQEPPAAQQAPAPAPAAQQAPAPEAAVIVSDPTAAESPPLNGFPDNTLNTLFDGQQKVIEGLGVIGTDSAGNKVVNQTALDNLSADEREIYDAAVRIQNSISVERARRNAPDQVCNTKQTSKGWSYENPSKCEEYLNSVAFQEAIQRYKKDIVPADPCGKGTLSAINTKLLSFFKTLKKIKKYGNLYVNGTLNNISQLSNLIRNTSSIIASILKVFVQRLRNYLLGKIRAGIQDLIDKLLPTVAKTIKNTIIQKVVDNILCKFKDIAKGLVQMVGDFLFELVGKIVNVPFCAAQQFTNAMLNKLGADIDRAIGPVLDQINDVLGPVTKVVGSVFQAIDFVLGFESFLCEKPNCPDVKSFIGNPRQDGPSQEEIDNFNNFIPSSGDIVEGATAWTKDLPIFGGTLGQYDGTLPDSVTSCDTSAFKCGPPTVEIFGGGGAGAIGNAVVNRIGQIVGVDLVWGGSNYSSPPFVSFIDNCENGNYASGYAVIDNNGVVVDIVMVNNGSGYLSQPSGLDEFGEPVEIFETEGASNDYIVCLTGFDILSTGIGYNVEDTVQFIPEIPNVDTSIKITEVGQILEIQLSNKVCGITEIPEVEINSVNGSGVEIKPKFEFINLKTIAIGIGNIDDPTSIGIGNIDDPTSIGIGNREIITVIDCVK